MSEAPVAAAGARPDRRSFPRVQLAAPVLVDAGRCWLQCRGRDISAGGLAVWVDESLPPGTMVEVYFELPPAVAVETGATIVWTDRGLIGIRFVELSGPPLVAVRAFVRASRLRVS